MEIKPIAYFWSPFPEKFGIPRQAGLAPALHGRIVFEPAYRSADALRGLEGFDYLWLIWEFSSRKTPEHTPPRHPLGGLRGVPLRLPASLRSESLEEVVAASLAGSTHATLGTVRGGTGASLCEASGGAERSEAVESPELAATGSYFQATVRPPRLGGNRRVGVFASRSPFRPNPLGLSSVRLESIDYEAKGPDGKPIGPVINVLGADLMDGTPIYDIKPYVEYADSHPGARSGFVDTTSWEPLEVIFPESARNTGVDLDALKEILSLDPRPRYQDDPAKEYGMSFGGKEVRFRVEGKTLTVISIDSP